jgi:hypothetical protein
VPVTLRVLTPLVLAGSALVLLTGCNSSTSSPGTSSTAPSAPAGATSTAAPPSGAPSGLPSDAQAQFAKIQECLSAAGITLPAPSLPAGATPGGSFSPPAGGGAGGGQLNDPRVKAALEACGLSLPSGAPGGNPSANPTSS